MQRHIRHCLLSLLGVLLILVGCDEWKPPQKPPQQYQVTAFTAEWCAPCRRQKPVIQALESQEVRVVWVDIDRYPRLRRKYAVESVPTYLVFCGSDLVLRTHDANAVVRQVQG